MPLRSKPLKDDQALQSCLTSDQAHVVPGARGAHVAKIQQALVVLDCADIALPELTGRNYGPSTTAAVLAFKQKRKIINYAYQKTADNIVGKMTIATMDEELIAIDESRPPRKPCSGGGGSPRTVQAISSPAVGKPRKLFNATIEIICQETYGARQAGGAWPLGVDLIERARELMRPHAIDFRQGSFLDFMGPMVPDYGNVLAGSDATTFSVRAAAERVLKGFPNHLRIIFCPFDDKENEARGVTCGGTVADWTFPNFCLINVRKRAPDRGTMLHEIVHAAHLDRHENHDVNPTSILSTGDSRSQLPLEHAKVLSEAYFASHHF